MPHLAARPLTTLVIEDQDELNELLVSTIRSEGYVSGGVRSVEDYERLGVSALPDIFIVDLNLPGEDGLSFAGRIRNQHPHVGIIMLTARSELQHRAQGYENGADIYLTKPSTKDELLGALNALARRLRPAAPSVPATDLVLNLRRLSLTGPAASVNLSSEEADLIRLALECPGGRISFDDIRGVLNRGEDISKAALEIKIVRLRKKIADTGLATRSIASMRNFGYQALFSCTLTDD